MSHVRKQIRDYALGQLTGLTTTGSNAYASRVYDLTNAKLPAVLVYTQSESISEMVFSKKRVQTHNLELVVEGYVRQRTTFDDLLDTLSVEVEEALLDDPTFGGLAVNATLNRVELDFNGDADQPVGTVSMTFAVEYRTETGSPETAI